MNETILNILEKDIETKTGVKLFNNNMYPDLSLKLYFLRKENEQFIFKLVLAQKTINTLQVANYINNIEKLTDNLPFNCEEQAIENYIDLKNDEETILGYYFTKDMAESSTDDESISSIECELYLIIKA